jgi:hypothetical protein
MIFAAAVGCRIFIAKKNVKLSLCLIKYYARKIYGGLDGITPLFLTSALDGGEWPASRLGGFNPEKIAAVPIRKEVG